MARPAHGHGTGRDRADRRTHRRARRRPRAGDDACRLGGERAWWSYSDVDLDDGDFAEIGASFERSGAPVRVGRVGRTTARLFAFRDAVDHAAWWLPVRRRRSGGG
ncbi:AAC(3) family N-acetyltransferase [Streptomyces sp. NBC_00582]|nr:AAC(3) family N-acetyltransferase [Streptomyces sp. NBC_00582]